MHSTRLLRRADVCASVGTIVGKSCDDQVTDARRHPWPPQMPGARMTEPNDVDLIALATPYALHAVPDAELADIERRVAAAPPDVAAAFAEEVRAVRETMAVVSAATAVEPPDHLRARLLTEVSGDPVRTLNRRIKRWQAIGLAAAAAVVIGLGALSVGIAMQPKPTPSTAEQVFAAP